VFGEVIEGMKVVEQIEKLGTPNGQLKSMVFITASGVLS
jgi:cyclophilin family peptidyl-prolyl cis-trans isomerase